MNLNEFNQQLNSSKHTITKNFKRKEKCFSRHANFIVDLLKYDKHAGTNEFIDSLSSYMYLPYILHPTRVTGHSQIIIENIFSMFQKKQCAEI